MLILLVIPGIWNYNGNIICDEVGYQRYPVIIPSGDDKAIIVWTDERVEEGSGDIYAQRIDFDGNILWQTNGIVISNADYSQVCYSAISDSSGGGIICWMDSRNGIDYDVYAQRVDSMGNALWETNGKPICVKPGYQLPFKLIQSDNKSAIVIWLNYIEAADKSGIYTQKIDSLGNILWGEDGIVIRDTFGLRFPFAISDNLNGAFIVWDDSINDNWKIYGQRIDQNGDLLWGEGVSICDTTGIRGASISCFDGSGGMFVFWEDFRSDTIWDLYGQRVDGNGNILWEKNGILIADSIVYFGGKQVFYDNSGGTIIVWTGFSDNDTDIYAQRIDGNGNKLWGENGIPICDTFLKQFCPIGIFDGTYMIVVWLDERFHGGLEYNIYAQKIDLSGNVLWEEGGVLICDVDAMKGNQSLISDCSGGAIITWEDFRNGWTDKKGDIYAQRVFNNGQVGIKDKDKPNVQNIFFDYFSIKGYEGEKVYVYNITGSLCGTYYGNRIGGDLNTGIYFVKMKDKLYKIMKIR